MFTCALLGLEKALNTYLQLDPDSIKVLSRLTNKTIKVEITDWRIEFFIIPKKDGLQLLNKSNQEPDTIITGTLFGLFKAGCARGKGSALFANAIEIKGNTKIGETIREVMTNIDIDWEEHLAKFVGDTLAHRININVKRTLNFGKHATQALRENLTEYLQMESEQVPTQVEVETFIKKVTTLQHDVERAEIRCKRLLAKRNLCP